MPRALSVGNGNLQVNLDADLSIRDLYFPFVGMENHVNGHYCKFGVWVAGRFTWVDDTWSKRFRYKKDSLVTEVSLQHPTLQVRLDVEDGVHHLHDVFLRKVTVRNEVEDAREVRLFFSHDLHLLETDRGITAYYYPHSDAVIHFKKDRYILVSGSSGAEGLYQYAVGVTEFGGLKGTWKDAEDGELSRNPVAHGSVDSTVSLRVQVPGQGQAAAYYWLATGTQVETVSNLHHIVASNTPELLLQRTRAYHESWVTKSAINFGDLTPDIVTMFKRSLLVLRTQIDNRGGIIASGDSDILRFNKDTYSYVWPRDGAFVAIGLDAAGYHTITQRFFKFCADIVRRSGFLYQKYHPDGSWGSTWHPWIDPDRAFQLPIQEDETALVIHALWNHYGLARDIEFIATLYEPLICNAADFMVKYRDENALPLPSYDLWEETRGVTTFTASAIYGGLLAASKFARLFGDERAEDYRGAADEVKQAILTHLYDGGEGRFLKQVQPDGRGGYVKDTTIDSSAFAIFAFGVLDVADPRVEGTMQAIESALTVKTEVGGVARYRDDRYHQVSRDIDIVPGNPWPICTMWLAEWYIAKGELEAGRRLLTWVADHASDAGLLAEQIHPYTNQPLSVSPLTWSHSTYVLTVMKYLERLSALEVCPACGLPMYGRR